MRSDVVGTMLRSIATRFRSLRALDVQRKLLFQTPIQEVLCGLYLNDSGFDPNVFYPELFVQPLYKKEERLVFNISKRAVGNWSASDAPTTDRLCSLLEQEGFPFWDQCGTPSGVAAQAAESNNPHTQLAKAYSLILIGNFEEAHERLSNTIEVINNSLRNQPRIPWMIELKSEAEQMVRCLQQDRDSATRILQNNRITTLQSLNLVPFCSASVKR